MPPAARIGDMHTCPLHGGGPILPPCCPTVLIGHIPAARVGDLAACSGAPDAIATGSPTVIIGNMMAARIGDLTVHGGVIVAGLPSVDIGLPAQAGALAGAAESGAPFAEKCRG